MLALLPVEERSPVKDDVNWRGSRVPDRGCFESRNQESLPIGGNRVSMVIRVVSQIHISGIEKRMWHAKLEGRACCANFNGHHFPEIDAGQVIQFLSVATPSRQQTPVR